MKKYKDLISEISDDKLNSYINGALVDIKGRLKDAHRNAKSIDDKEKISDKSRNRLMSVLKAQEKLNKSKK